MITDFTKIIGLPFDQLDLDESTYTLDYNDPKIYDDLTEGWTVESNDRTWEMLLTEERVIETVILFASGGEFPIFNLNHNNTAASIKSRFGIPQRSEKETLYANCKEGFYEQYEYHGLSYHFEFSEPLQKLLAIAIYKQGQHVPPHGA